MTNASALSKEYKRAARHRSFAKARKLYALLLRLVGGSNPVCEWCRRSEHECELTLDHRQGKSWRANTIRMDERIKRYRDEFKRGVKFRILCRECNAKDGRARQLEGRVAVVAARMKRKLQARPSRHAQYNAEIDNDPRLDALFDGDTVPF